jgi:hypothetical protein
MFKKSRQPIHRSHSHQILPGIGSHQRRLYRFLEYRTRIAVDFQRARSHRHTVSVGGKQRGPMGVGYLERVGVELHLIVAQEHLIVDKTVNISGIYCEIT